jgi:hypothetical protein
LRILDEHPPQQFLEIRIGSFRDDGIGAIEHLNELGDGAGLIGTLTNEHL